MTVEIGAERLAYWYLRLNGCLTIPNFVVHPDKGRDQETDVDIIGVRFPYRMENLERPMRDDSPFLSVGKKTLVALVEVKTRRMGLNGPWTARERKNMLRVLCAVGILPMEEARLATQALYDEGSFSNLRYLVTIMCIGRDVNSELMRSYPAVPQITWNEVLAFIWRRFAGYEREKRSHGQWDADGRSLWDAATSCHTSDDFTALVRIGGQR